MKAMANGFRKRVLAAGALFCFVLIGSITATPQAGQEQYGRPAASIDAAKAPAFVARRARLMEAHKDAVILIPSQYKARDGAMRDNLNFLYLTGLKEPEAVLLLDPAGSPRETIFRRSAAGPGGPGGARIPAGGGMISTSGGEVVVVPRPAGSGMQPPAQEAPAPTPDKGLVEKPNTQLASSLFLMSRSGRAFRVFLPFSDFDFLSRTFTGMNPLAQAEAILNVDPTVFEMRLTKDADEIAALREAIDLTADALNEAYRAAEPGMSEVDLAAILRYAFNKRETEDSFLQAASGPNSTNVHFGATSRPLAAGDLIVFDVGTWIRGYTSDISRTIPANGRFTKEQRELYSLVLEAEKAGCARLVPGVTFKAVQDEVENILMAGLAKLMREKSPHNQLK
jgi:Xaa-Pro aminopeptidase